MHMFFSQLFNSIINWLEIDLVFACVYVTLYSFDWYIFFCEFLIDSFLYCIFFQCQKLRYGTELRCESPSSSSHSLVMTNSWYRLVIYLCESDIFIDSFEMTKDMKKSIGFLSLYYKNAPFSKHHWWPKFSQ